MSDTRSFHVERGNARPGAWSRERIAREHQRAEELRERLQLVDQSRTLAENRCAVAEAIQRERADDGR